MASATRLDTCMEHVLDAYHSFHCNVATAYPLCISSSCTRFWAAFSVFLPLELPSTGVQVRVWATDRPMVLHVDVDTFMHATACVLNDITWRDSVTSAHNIPDTLVWAVALNTTSELQTTMFSQLQRAPLTVTPPMSSPWPLCNAYVVVSGCLMHVNTLSVAVLVAMRMDGTTDDVEDVEHAYARLASALNGTSDVAVDCSNKVLKCISDIKVRGFSTDIKTCQLLDAMRNMGDVGTAYCVHTPEEPYMLAPMLPYAMPDTLVARTAARAMTRDTPCAAAWACAARVMLESLNTADVTHALAVPPDYITSVTTPVLVKYANACDGTMLARVLRAVLNMTAPVWVITDPVARSILSSLTRATAWLDVLTDVRDADGATLKMILEAVYVPCTHAPRAVAHACTAWPEFETGAQTVTLEDVIFSIEHTYKTGACARAVPKLRARGGCDVDTSALKVPCVNPLACVALTMPIVSVDRI